jgi:Ca2+-binding EF-hand superfamily protein
VEFFSERVRRAITDRNRKRSERALALLRKTFAGAISKGTNARDIFAHLDQDKSGRIDVGELMATIKKLPTFKKMSEADMSALLDVLDKDRSGDITFDEFMSFLEGEDGLDESSASVGSQRSTGGPGGAPATLIDRIRDTFKLAEQHGLSFEKAFNLLDRDGSGGITVAELHAALVKLPNFRNVAMSEVQELHTTIDANHNGEVSIDEFRYFVKEGKLYVPSGREEHKGGDKDDRRGKGAAGAGQPLAPELVRELFIRHMKRISVHDGGVSGLLAYLDDDEDGLISLATLKSLLRREDVFEAIPEEQVVQLLEPMMADTKRLRATALLRFIEGGKVPKGHGGEDGKADDEELVVAPKEYQFSSDPEIRALEKKVRGFGHILAKKGVDVESLFRAFDPKGTGAVRRTELLEVLSKLGMYILEQGRVLEQAATTVNDIQRVQQHQVNRLKGKGGDFLQNAPRMARRLLMSGGVTPEGDFKVSLALSRFVVTALQGGVMVMMNFPSVSNDGEFSFDFR